MVVALCNWIATGTLDPLLGPDPHTGFPCATRALHHALSVFALSERLCQLPRQGIRRRVGPFDIMPAMSTTPPIPDLEVLSRYALLKDDVERHNRLYYQDAAPEITDQAFDALLRDLEALEREFPTLQQPDSPTLRVGGAPLGYFETARHRVPMLSIDNTYSDPELREFDARVRKGLDGESPTYVAELKLDGIAISLHYQNHVLVRAVTRGDGLQGDVITENIRTIRSLPLRIDAAAPASMEVRGEVYMTTAELKRLNVIREANGEEPYRNPRNTTAGTLKQLDSREVAKRNLSICLYDIVPDEGVEAVSHSETLKRLKAYGFPTNEHSKTCPDIEAAIEHCRHWSTERFKLDYEIDGMVIKVDDPEQRKRLGTRSKSPRWIIAFKFPAEVGRTLLRDITVQVGKSGALTPVAELDPVPLAGTIVKRASLYNFEDLAKKDLRIGDTVEVQKAGEIIPQVLRFVPELRPADALPFLVPEVCPECKMAAHKDPDDAVLRCVNLACPAQVKERLTHYASRTAMDIEGLGPALIEQLVQRGLVHDPADLYQLEAGAVASLDRMAEKSARNLIAAIDASRGRSLRHLLYGLGIRHVGSRLAEILAGHFGTLDGLMAASEEELTGVEEVGAVVARSVRDFFEVPANQELVARLRASGLNLEEIRPETAETNANIAGKTFVVTGTLTQFTRDEIHDRIKALGGKASSSISAKTDYLVAGEKAGSKLAKAESLGVKVLTETEFQQLVEGNS